MCCAEPLLQLVGTVLQADVVMLSVVGGNQVLIMRGAKLENQAETEASPLKRIMHKLAAGDSCANTVISDTDTDPRCGWHAFGGTHMWRLVHGAVHSSSAPHVAPCYEGAESDFTRVEQTAFTPGCKCLSSHT